MRQKTVFTDTSAIAHLWANQQQDEAKNPSRNFYFTGNKIYSYGSHFCIAAIHTNKQGKKAVLFTTRGYSNTTSKHLGIVRQACSQYERIYCEHPEYAERGEHKANLEAFEQEAKYIAQRNLKNARKPEIYLNQIAGQRLLAEAYCEYFGLQKELKKLVFIYITNKDEYNGAVAKDLKRIHAANKAAEKAAKKRQAELLIKEQVNVKEWKQFNEGYEDDRARLYVYSNYSYLRFNPKTNRIETSQRIEIPVKIGERAFKWYLDTLKKGGCTGECNFKILDYEVREVTKEYIRIGCHLITAQEVNEIALKLGWIQG